jgi:hypothetical protein
VLFDIDKEALAPQPVGQGGIDSPDEEDLPRPTRKSEAEEDFSHQRILMDATDGTYRPDDLLDTVFDVDDPETRR